MSVFVSTAAVGDPESTRRVYASIIVLASLGVAMTVLAVWLFRRTRPEPQLLAPLEAMESRRWRTSEPAEQARVLDAKRPEGATPLRRSTSAPTFDTEFDDARPVRSFDDLADDAASAVDAAPGSTPALDPTPLGTAAPVARNADDDADNDNADNDDADDDTLERDRPPLPVELEEPPTRSDASATVDASSDADDRSPSPAPPRAEWPAPDGVPEAADQAGRLFTVEESAAGDESS
ncbi:MAG: hypothetical protein AB8G26_20390 [Ilumatobacter sp.]